MKIDTIGSKFIRAVLKIIIGLLTFTILFFLVEFCKYFFPYRLMPLAIAFILYSCLNTLILSMLFKKTEKMYSFLAKEHLFFAFFTYLSLAGTRFSGQKPSPTANCYFMLFIFLGIIFWLVKLVYVRIRKKK